MATPPLMGYELPTMIGANPLNPNPILEEPTYLLGDDANIPVGITARATYVVNE